MRNPVEMRPELSPHSMALRLALTYLFSGGLWVAFSDRLLGAIGLPRDVERFIGTIKGTLFVLVTAVVLYVLSRAGLTRVRRAQLATREQEARIRQAYVDVLDVVTGGRLVLVTDAELGAQLGTPLAPSRTISSAKELAGARAAIREVARRLLPDEEVPDVLSASSEALDNALKHGGGSASFETLRRDGSMQVQVTDHGPGIDFRLLPKATLRPGFSTAQTLGMGFTIMLQLSRRVLICSSPGSTAIVLEFPTTPDGYGTLGDGDARMRE